MKFSYHWDFSWQEFAFLYFATLPLWACFYLLAGEQLRSWTSSHMSWPGLARFLLELGFVWALLLACGLALSHRVGLHPLALGLPRTESSMAWAAIQVVARGLLWGLAVAVTFELSTRVFFSGHLEQWNATARFGNWRSFLVASIGASLGEEVLYRLFLFPLVAWLAGLIWKTTDGLPTVGAMWVSLIAVSLLMAAAHLSVLEDLGGYTLANIVRGMLVFTPPALLLGVAFWKQGIETAMIAHASALIFSWLFLSTIAVLAQARHTA
jgi:membrane protease YdiL (CAAX protease family)